MMTARRRRERATDGFILVAALWIVSALAALSAVYAVYVSSTAMAVAVTDDDLRAQALTRAAVELAAGQLLAVPEERRPRHGAFDFRLGGAAVSVTFRTEAARIDLNGASKKLIAGLFRSLGAQVEDADQYAERVIGWRVAPNVGAQDREGSLYRAAGLAYGPRGAPFAHAGELTLVLGLPPALVERALPFVTVFGRHEDVNILEAAPEVIAALPGMTPAHLSDVLAQRATLAPGQSATAVLGSVQNAATSDTSKAMRVTVLLALDNGRRIASEVVIMIDGRDEPYQVLSWQNDIGPPARPDLGSGARR